MIRQAAFVLCSVIGVAQVPQQDPFDIANQAYFQVRQKGQYDVASKLREEMKRLLQAEAPDDPQFAGRTQSLAQFYDGDGMSAAGRAVLEGALARAEAANVPGQTRASLLLSLASLWEGDRNLLKSLASIEKATAILEQTPATEAPAQSGERPAGWIGSGRAGMAIATRPGVISVFGSFPGGIYALPSAFNRTSVYTRLADLYQRLGRRDQAAAVLAKLKALPAQPNNWNLAQYYQQHGDLEQAVAIYRKQMEDSASDPRQIVFPAELLANIYEQMKRPDDAVAVLREALAAVESSGDPILAGRIGDLRGRLAILLFRNGHAEAADQAYPPPTESGPTSSGPALNYANYLGMTQRAAKGETFLADYLASHSSLNAGEQATVLMSLANLARMTGDSKRAEEYQIESEKKREPRDPPADVVLVGPVLQKAQSQANRGNTAEAITLATTAIAQSRNAQDRDAFARMMPPLTGTIGNKAPAQADELYRNLIATTQSWSADTMEPWLNALAGYPRFLMSEQRIGEALPAIERYQSALKTARGGDTGWMEEPLRFTIEVERARNSLPAATLAAQNLVALEESLDGPASEPLYRAVETLAQLYRSTGDPARSLPLYQQTIVIADAVFPADDSRRSQSRTNAAAALMVEHRPDEAEALVLEAMQIRKALPAGSRDGLEQMLEQIRAMKKTH